MSAFYYWTYFDIETLGLDIENDKIITVQYQNLVYDEKGKPMHNEHIQNISTPGLHIVKEWSNDEATMLRFVFQELLSPERRKYFEPLGNNLSFEGRFLKAKFRKYGIIGKDEHLGFGHLKMIDLFPVMKLVNGGERTTAKFFGKVGENKKIPDWYKNKEYGKIEHYIREETKSFVKVMDYLMMKMPQLRNEILSLHN